MRRRRAEPRRRDRRGRGLRGPLVPDGVPLARTRAEAFDELVLASVSRLERTWSDQLDGIELVVADVPDLGDRGDGDEDVPLGRAEAAAGARPARIVVHRRTIEARVRGQRAREALVHEVVVAQLAELLGLDPAVVDPELGPTD